MRNPSVQTIKEWLHFRTFTLDRFIKEYNITTQAIESESRMYQLHNLTLVHEPSVFQMQFYFYPSGALAIIRVYQALLKQLSIHDITAFYGKPESIERSSAGKMANYAVYAKEGFAFSSEGNEMHFLDLFPSTSTEAYIKNTYLPPGPFIR